MKNIVIIGAGGFAREVQWLIEDINKVYNEWNIIGFLDKDIDTKDKMLNGNIIIGDFKDIKEMYLENLYYVCCIADNELRKKLVSHAEKLNMIPATLIHPSVIMSEFVEIGKGSIICAGTILTVNIEIGEYSIINLDCTIGHDTIIENYTTILPSVNISGGVIVEKLVTIGTGSFLIQNIKIGKKSYIGAGSVVISDVPENVTVVGSPARIVKYNS